MLARQRRRRMALGLDSRGQFGNGAAGATIEQSRVEVAGGHTWRSLTAGVGHPCGVDTDGAAWCWGLDSQGQPGNRTDAGDQQDPVKVVDPST